WHRRNSTECHAAREIVPAHPQPTQWILISSSWRGSLARSSSATDRPHFEHCDGRGLAAGTCITFPQSKQ
ncbi:MAG TPA: hypothetical protein VIZ69_00535, partial [Thermoanaerobaculia bacterium]